VGFVLAIGAMRRGLLNYFGLFIVSILIVSFNKKFWEKLLACFPLMRHGTHTKHPIQQVFLSFPLLAASFHACFLFGLFFAPRDGGDVFRKIG
jgi:hypothetical protein